MDKLPEKAASDIVKAQQDQRIRFVDLPDSDPEKFDRGKFTEILINMKGSRTIRDFATETDLSESFVSKAVNGYIDRPPSKKTMMKLLSAMTDAPEQRRELLQYAGYSLPEDLDWDEPKTENTNQRTVSATEAITRYFGESDFLAAGSLMKSLSEHGVDGNINSYFFRSDGYFEIKDEKSGQVYVGINLYCNPDKKGENAEVALVFSLALTFNKIVRSDDVSDKVVIIMTNDEKIFEGCQTINFEKVPKATLVVLFADDHSIVQKETVLYGASPISLLDE